MAKKFITDFRGDFSPNWNFMKIKDEPISPMDNDFENHLNYSFEHNHGEMRKSLSMNDIANIKEEIVNLKLTDNKDDVYIRHRKTYIVQDLSKNKFVSMAEAIYHYQRDTPDRFRSSKPNLFHTRRNLGPSGLTRPQSPMLRCKNRARPLHILSQKEKEELELEEIRKYKIKANPIPKSVIEGFKNLPEVTRKPVTVPEPFKLTEVHKKVPQSPEHFINFKAKPAPKHILEKPCNIPAKPIAPSTKAVSPKFHYKRAFSADHLKNDLKTQSKQHNGKKPEKCDKTVQHHGPVKPEPFSFEKRDEEVRRKREEKIRLQLEEERKLASQFKAQPLPAAVKKRMQCNATSTTSNTSSENKENNVKFEAKPPLVLYKKPFKPVLQPAQLITPIPFDLTSEKRAADRERFDKQLREKEEEMERIRLQKEQEQREAEERELAELRAKLVHHAKPVPSLIPVLPEKSVQPLTVPETPKFVRRLKKN